MNALKAYAITGIIAVITIFVWRKTPLQNYIAV